MAVVEGVVGWVSWRLMMPDTVVGDAQHDDARQAGDARQLRLESWRKTPAGDGKNNKNTYGFFY